MNWTEAMLIFTSFSKIIKWEHLREKWWKKGLKKQREIQKEQGQE